MQHEINTAVIELLPPSDHQETGVVSLDDVQLEQVVGGLGPNACWGMGPNDGW